MPKKLKYTIMIFSSLLLALLVMSGVSTFASNGDVMDQVENISKIALWLEDYGIPVALSSAISGLGVSGAVYLVSRGLKKSSNETKSTLKEVGATSEKLKQVNEKLDGVLVKLENYEKEFITKLDNSFNEKILPVYNEIQIQQQELKDMQSNIENGIGQIVKDLEQEV